ncbi:MAG: hypothetical protein N2746_04345 [Deltaproteobacteria bacterium]|nr:hypothetical protein [Deltaproteobacteria bacterium]
MSKFVLIFLFIILPINLLSENRCKEWDIKLPNNIRPEKAFFDSYISNNLIIVGEGGNGIFLYEIYQKNIKQIYYSRVITESVKQTSIKSLQFEPFYRRGVIKEIDIYFNSKMPKSYEKIDICKVKNGKVFCLIDGREEEITPFLGDVENASLSADSNLLLFSNKYSGGYVFGVKTKEIAKLGFGSDFKFVNTYDVIFVYNSKIGDKCSNSYIYYWHNQAVDSFLVYKDRGACIRYPDANKDDLIFIKDFRIYKCPLNLIDAVLSK